MQIAASYVARAAAWNIVSAGRGPAAAMPSPFKPSIAGAMIVVSSVPIDPPSPACGLSPLTASRGVAIANLVASSLETMRHTDTIASVVSDDGTRDSAIWMVTGTARIPGPASIITGVDDTPKSRSARWPRNSVWPGYLKPAS